MQLLIYTQVLLIYLTQQLPIDLGSAAQGWLTGGMIKLTAQSATRWHCAAYLHGDGTLATPFE